MENKVILLQSKDSFREFTTEFKEKNKMPFAFGVGIAYKDSEKNTIATKWLTVNYGVNLGTAAVLMYHLGISLEKNSFVYHEASADEAARIYDRYFEQPFECDLGRHENIRALQKFKSGKVSATWCCVFYREENFLLTEKIQNIADAHFRLASISRRHYRPNVLCLDGILPTLPTNVWTHDRVYSEKDWDNLYWWEQETPLVLKDKFPLLCWGAPIPTGIRMPNPYSARLGAYLSEGTTVMHYGFINFNAGTLGAAMVEGTIAAGVIIGHGTDIGKGGGFLGTLSGGNKTKLYAGEKCLIGALAECGVPLGNNCVVSTGTCFTENTPFTQVDEKGRKIRNSKVLKAIHFRDIDGITFRRNSKNGRLEVLRKGNVVELNPELHHNSNLPIAV